MAVAIPAGTRHYFYYPDGHYELRSITPSAGGPERSYQRSFLGPIPTEELYRIIQGGHIDPAAADWQEQLTALLNQHQFFTINILYSRGTDVGKVWSQYIKENLTIGIALRVAAAVFLIFLLLPVKFFVFLIGFFHFLPLHFVTQFLPIGFITHILPIAKIAHFALPLIQKIAASPMARLIMALWKKVSLSKAFLYCFAVVPAYGVASLANLLPQDHVLFRLKTHLDAGMANIVANAVGIENYEFWRDQVYRAAFAHVEDRLIPPQFAEDRILGSDAFLCPIANVPMRYPCRLPCNHVFELISIEAWRNRCRDQHAENISCPTCRAETPLETFDRNFLHIDQDLSDTIELRILLLSALLGPQPH